MPVEITDWEPSWHAWPLYPFHNKHCHNLHLKCDICSQRIWFGRSFRRKAIIDQGGFYYTHYAHGYCAFWEAIAK